jgi:hypothetical protein
MSVGRTDYLSAHKTKAVEQFLAEHPKVHFTSRLLILPG